MRKSDLLPAAVFMVGIHAFLALVVTLVAWEKGWPSAGGGSWDDLGWALSTLFLGVPWSATAADNAGTAWDLLFLAGAWINVGVHAGFWCTIVELRRRHLRLDN